MKKQTITDEWEDARLDRFIRAVYDGLSFSAAQQMIRKKQILLNGHPANGKTRLSAGDIVEIPDKPDEKRRVPAKRPTSGFLYLDEESSESLRERFGSIGAGIQILYEDDDLMVINKPPGLPVQPGNEKEKGSLLDLLGEYYQKTDRIVPDEGGIFYPTPVHRLDMGTSGALIIAKTRKAARRLSDEIKNSRLKKVYLAVVEGIPDPEEGRITALIKTQKRTGSRSRIDSDGRKAETFYLVKKVMPGNRSLVEIRITTGRTHQIRVHLSSIGCPVEGDQLYGSRNGAKRLMLHAWKISFLHPDRENTVDVTAPAPDLFER
ncbi:MAG: RluA family pseudouridine synthase [Candidatus Krumholzibacteriota bacterium]|nr:RluA family pseudouridine synthase [Candidatus Krumholzibacteriota bacterium]